MTVFKETNRVVYLLIVFCSLSMSSILKFKKHCTFKKISSLLDEKGKLKKLNLLPLRVSDVSKSKFRSHNPSRTRHQTIIQTQFKIPGAWSLSATPLLYGNFIKQDSNNLVFQIS